MLNKMIVAIVFGIFLSPYANADINSSNCKDLAELAEVVMTDRQMVGSILNSLATRDSIYEENGDEYMYQMLTLLIEDAYKQPRFTIEKYQDIEINRFVERYYLGCIEASRLED